MEPSDMSNATSTAAGEIQVTLIPLEQDVGGTVLVNACGLAQSSNTTVTAGNLVVGFPESDAEGNLLYALGISEDMSGSVTVTVEDDDGNVGSASFTVIESQEEEQQAPENATSTGNDTQPTNNLTSTGNLTASNNNGTTTTTSNETSTGSATNSLEEAGGAVTDLFNGTDTSNPDNGTYSPQ
jgi:hypothetical protein